MRAGSPGGLFQPINVVTGIQPLNRDSIQMSLNVCLTREASDGLNYIGPSHQSFWQCDSAQKIDQSKLVAPAIAVRISSNRSPSR
jgi:hypothetical protein